MLKDDRHSSDSIDSNPGSEAGENQEIEVDEVHDGPLAQLLVELGAAKEESDQLRDRFLRKAAELENYRKRTDKERAELVIQAKSGVLLEILPVIDACERAMGSFDEIEDTDQALVQYREGVELLYKQLSSTIFRLGVVPIEAKGQKFDPHLHEALTREETVEFEENTVTQELRRGYLYKDRLLRPVQVIVATRPQEEEKADI
jgi:molecular chaperone GrpE